MFGDQVVSASSSASLPSMSPTGYRFPAVTQQPSNTSFHLSFPVPIRPQPQMPSIFTSTLRNSYTTNGIRDPYSAFYPGSQLLNQLQPSGCYPLLPQQQLQHPLTTMMMMMGAPSSIRHVVHPERSISCSLGAGSPPHNDLKTNDRPRKSAQKSKVRRGHEEEDEGLKRSRKKPRLSTAHCDPAKGATCDDEHLIGAGSLPRIGTNSSPVSKKTVTKPKNRRTKKICVANDELFSTDLNTNQSLILTPTNSESSSPSERFPALNRLHSDFASFPRPSFSSTPKSKSDVHGHFVDYAIQSVDKTIHLGDNTCQPVNSNIRPVDQISHLTSKAVSQPVKEIGQPVHKTINQPIDRFSQPIDRFSQPIDRFSQPVNKISPEPTVDLPVAQAPCHPMRQLNRQSPALVHSHPEQRTSGSGESPGLSSGSSSVASSSSSSSSSSDVATVPLVQPWSNPDSLRRSYVRHAQERENEIRRLSKRRSELAEERRRLLCEAERLSERTEEWMKTKAGQRQVRESYYDTFAALRIPLLLMTRSRQQVAVPATASSAAQDSPWSQDLVN